MDRGSTIRIAESEIDNIRYAVKPQLNITNDEKKERHKDLGITSFHNSGCCKGKLHQWMTCHNKRVNGSPRRPKSMRAGRNSYQQGFGITVQLYPALTTPGSQTLC
ncbi:hypothetical protein ONS95_008394 [Cadophora gregata]|uniref:uncharacterized protein n=1 Tax=Cadophora gregata TaxID=51156 RepID=UPI0026DD487D|nr:uncharacterized protein ONS95_008394 [Cadophora gregata]KAK0126815.1 hypothetical protein ONS95_008394 [Cadophora gregata]